jgi:hypothetical protein
MQPTEAQVLDALEAALTELVRAAPGCEAGQVERAASLAVALALHAAVAERADAVALGCALEHCLELISTGQVDAGIALPALAMAAHSARSASDAAIAAARYEVETLLPVPGQPARPRRGPEVPLSNLLRNAARQTAPVPVDRLNRVAAGWPDAAKQQVAAARERLRLT